MNIEITSFPVAPLGCTCSILRDKVTGETIVVDPGGEGPKITALLEEKGCKVRYIIHTHAHFDHVLGTHDVANHCRSRNQTPDVRLHPGDQFLYKMLAKQCGWFGLPPAQPVEVMADMADNEEFTFGEHKLTVLHTPGHTPGSCSFHLANEGILFSGDTLFAGGIGRTDLPGGDYSQIMTSIKERLLTLDDGTTVIPGHGDFTRIFEEKQLNPFL